ncbi:hypothetical protein COOONC_00983 [Cooperia oncophora]
MFHSNIYRKRSLVTFPMSSVTVLCPNARRCSVKVTPGMLMRQVLEEACLKNGFDADEYQLSNQNRSVDLALPFRLSGLPNNATLEMVQAMRISSDSKVTIALQLPNGTRMENEFLVSTSLFEVLAFFSQSTDEDLTVTNGTSTPTCSYMNKQYSGPVELKRTTLSSIGISSGKCLLRYQRVNLTKEQLDDITARMACDAAQKEALLASYAKKKEENEQRAKLEAARMARFEEELRSKVDLKKLTDPNIKAEEPVDANAQTQQSVNPTFLRDVLRSPTRNQSGWSFDAPVFSTAPAAPPTPSDRLSNLSRLLQQDVFTLDEVLAIVWAQSVSRDVFSKRRRIGSSKLVFTSHTAAALIQVDASLSRPHTEHDRITDILAEEGRVPLSRIAVEATRVAESVGHLVIFASLGEHYYCCKPSCFRVSLQPSTGGLSTSVSSYEINVEREEAEVGLSDDFFEVSVDDVRARHRDLRKQVYVFTYPFICF